MNAASAQSARTLEKRARVAHVAQPQDGPVLVNLATVQPRAVSWLWPRRWVLAYLNLLVGEGDLGKSTVLLDLIARITAGLRFPDGALAPIGDVVLLTAEDGLADVVVPRLQAMGADLSKVVALTATRERGRERAFSLARDIEQLEAAVIKRKALAVVIDPLTAYLGGTDSHVDADVRGLLGPVAKLAETHDVAVLGLMHLNKSLQVRARHRIGGSPAFVNAARSVTFVVPDPDDSQRRLFVPDKMNLAVKPSALAFRLESAGTTSRLVWETEAVGTVDLDGALRGLEGGEERSAVEEAEGFLCELLATGPVATVEIQKAAERAALSWATVRRAKERLAVRASPTGNREGKRGVEGWSWALPAQAAPSREQVASKSVEQHNDGTQIHSDQHDTPDDLVDLAQQEADEQVSEPAEGARRLVLDMAQQVGFPALPLAPLAPHVTVEAGEAAWTKFVAAATNELFTAALVALRRATNGPFPQLGLA